MDRDWKFPVEFSYKRRRWLLASGLIEKETNELQSGPDPTSSLIGSRLQMDLQNSRKITDTFVDGVVDISGQKLAVVINIDGGCEGQNHCGRPVSALR